MTREQHSNTTLPPEGEEKRTGTFSLCQSEDGTNVLDPLQSEHAPQPVMFPREVVCSFCGVTTHGHKDCPVMYQYIREQADALAQQRMEEYNQLQEWARYDSPKQVPLNQEPLRRGGPMEKSQCLVKNHHGKGPKDKEVK